MSENESPATETPTPTVSDDMLIILPVRNLVLFPGTVLPVGDQPRALARRRAGSRARGAQARCSCCSTTPTRTKPTGDDLHRIGTVAIVLAM